MSILIAGINHKNASLKVREKINPQKIEKIITKKYFPDLFSEWTLLSTCNRSELLIVTENLKKSESVIKKLFQDTLPYIFSNEEAVRHMYAVASGSDSLVIGETEILAQMKEMYTSAAKKKSLGPILHQLCKDSIRVGKIARSSSQIANGTVSFAHVTVEIAQKYIPEFTTKKILIIGTGVLGKRLIKNLLAEDINQITVSNRTDNKAKNFSSELEINFLPYNKIEKTLYVYDVIMTATASPEIIIPASWIENSAKKRNYAPQFIFDLAVPRDVEENVAQFKNVRLFNIDEMQSIVEKTMKTRKSAIKQVNALIEKEVNVFWQWYQSRKTIPLLIALNKRAEVIQQKELEKALNKLRFSNLSEHDKKTITLLSKRITGKLLAKPLENIKKYSGDDDHYLASAFKIFDIDAS